MKESQSVIGYLKGTSKENWANFPCPVTSKKDKYKSESMEFRHSEKREGVRQQDAKTLKIQNAMSKAI